MRIIGKHFFIPVFIVTLLICHSGYSQPYTNLVLEGAGIRGIAYVGVLKVLEEKNLLPGINKVGGTSAGAITALAVSLGYSSKEIQQIVFNTKLQKFNDGKFFFIGGISRLNRNYGWYKGHAFSSWLEKLIIDKTGNANITFQQLHDRNFKDLYVTGTSLNNQKLIIFSYESYPSMRVKDAVRISMSVPLYFEAVLIDSAGTVISKKEKPKNYDLMVDGGMIGNFPLQIFDRIDTIENQPTRIVNRQTIGIRIDSPEQINADTHDHSLATIPIDHFNSYLTAFYNFVIENLNRHSLTDDDWARTVSVSSGTIGPKIKRLSADEKKFLINSGYDAMNCFLNK